MVMYFFTLARLDSDLKNANLIVLPQHPMVFRRCDYRI
jgi:hypothetical protein